MKIKSFSHPVFILPHDTLKGRNVLIVFLFIVANVCYGQLERYPLRHGTKSSVNPSVNKTEARTKQTEPLTLPFWDDFSNPSGIYPDTNRWHNSFTVWVTDGVAINPPTINAATFDGLDSAGSAYTNEVLLKGFTDSLISRVIDLSETSAKPVLPADRSTVFLSFAYQWQGNGEAPDIEEDYLIAEFKDSAGVWQQALMIRPKETMQRDLFYDTIVQVAGDQFFHDKFQFRIRAFGRQSGPFDTWNVDYVYLNKGRTITDLFFPDRAIASGLGNGFGRYNVIPYRHFLLNNQFSTPTFDVVNLQNGLVSINYNISTKVTSYHGDVPSPATELFDSVALESGSGSLAPRQRRTVTTFQMPGISLFDLTADSAVIETQIVLNSDDNNPTGDYDPAKYSPIEFTSNDTLKKTYSLASYYAYDDGTAEYAAGLIETGNLVAYQFELPAEVLQDTLIAFDIHFPPYGMTGNQTVDFYIYPDTMGLPDTGNAFRIPARSVRRKEINQFQRIEFLPALLIKQRRFYIGWREPVAGRVLVGLDISNDTGDRMFVNTNGFWRVNDRVTGSLMVRPVFGKGIVEASVGVEDEEKASSFSLYPNPTRGSFYIRGKVDRIEILTLTGNTIPFEHSANDESNTFIQLHQPAGLYLIRCTTGNVTHTRKLVITE